MTDRSQILAFSLENWVTIADSLDIRISGGYYHSSKENAQIGALSVKETVKGDYWQL